MDDYIADNVEGKAILYDNYDKRYVYVPAIDKWLDVKGAEYCLSLSQIKDLMENDLLYFSSVPFIQHIWKQRDAQRATLEPHTVLSYKGGEHIIANNGDTPAVFDCKHIVNIAYDKGWEFQLS